ncbi:MAG TPA: hypothetical protein VL126_14635 [Bacteroidota bacterium]|nr:hypothetical protein [Bacteroidota bacterium]
MGEQVDLAVAWDWDDDRPFLDLLASACGALGLRMKAIGRTEAAQARRLIESGALQIGAYLDRAAPEEETYALLSGAARSAARRVLNEPEAMRRAADKATMHLEFLSHGIAVPYTIIISPYAHERQVGLSLEELARLGRPFIIKPANTTGGGTGVILGAETLKDVVDQRKHLQNDKYLLQERVTPEELPGGRAWFRTFFVCGEIYLCWWDDRTHIYAPLEAQEARALGLEALESITREISRVCRLDFFSSEIARTSRRGFVVVDYVNEICDMRLQSLHPDGVPDPTVRAICTALASGSAVA